MKYLIDTNAWIGFFEGEPSFSPKVREVMTYENWDCVISLASIWEAAIKVGLEKLKLGYDLETELPAILEENGFTLLPIEYADTVGVRNLPHTHGDPFDRIQAVQAESRNLTVLSRDSVFDAYGLKRIW